MKVVLLALLFFSGAALCYAGDTGCTLSNASEKIVQRTSDGVNNVIQNSNPNGRVQEVKDVFNYNINCGSDAIKDGMKQFTGK
ncbi:hypothetical protein [Solidesulfovibrio carbinolicus]|uniref:hypothetical protein n=1 Tax=Solidesulfovibrio carbinolicus TaxID=296842 RepID=UPI0010111CE4|nr:hypothetical protein [Solidesulfovibrio carbinolicus]